MHLFYEVWNQQIEDLTEAATGGALQKRKIFLRIFQNPQEALTSESLFNKVVGLRPATLLKRDSDTGVFMWILQSS